MDRCPNSLPVVPSSQPSEGWTVHLGAGAGGLGGSPEAHPMALALPHPLRDQ